MKKISKEEIKKIQLEMLSEVDAFCRQHNLKYTLAYGTLIGAIRHKGFIPWDDDLDICMPYDDMLYLKENLKSENIEIADFDNCPNYNLPFPRIIHKKSYSRNGKKSVSYGVNIDLYVMIPCTSDVAKYEEIIQKGMVIYKNYHQAFIWSSRILRYLPVDNDYVLKPFLKKYREFLYDTLQDKNGQNYFCVASPLASYKKDTLNYNLFDHLIESEFENYKFLIPSCYDDYLKQQYGEYMALPPVDQRVPYHGGDYYWK